MRGVTGLVLLAVTAAPAAAQWDIGLEMHATHYRGSTHDTTGGGGPTSVRPSDATTVGLLLSRGIGRVRLGLRASYGKVGLTAAAPGLTLTDKTTGQVFEGGLALNFRVVGIG
jgi:hypothetical protein